MAAKKKQAIRVVRLPKAAFSRKGKVTLAAARRTVKKVLAEKAAIAYKPSCS